MCKGMSTYGALDEDAASTGVGASALLAGVEQVLRVEGLLQPRVQVVARRAELALELAALQPADPVFAGNRAAQAEGELEELVASRIRASLFVGIVRREEKRRMDVPVARVAERERRDPVALADLERLARHLPEAVERHGDVLAEGPAPLRQDRERRTAPPPPELRNVG